MALVAYQGEPGSYSEEALWRHFAGTGLEGEPCATFDDAVKQVLEGKAVKALLPVENTLVGPIEEAVAAVAGAGLVEHDHFWLAIQHCLIGHPGARIHDLERAFSHPAALDQCRNYLAGQGLQAIATGDTAGAVREVRERGDVTEAAVASRRAAALHGMEVLEAGIQDPGVNRTRFAIVQRRL